MIAADTARSSAALWDAISAPRALRANLNIWNGDAFDRMPFSDVLNDAYGVAGGLRARGVERGARVGAVLTNSLATVEGLIGIWLAGGVVVSLPVPARGMTPDEYCGQLRELCDRMEVGAFVTDDVLLEGLPALASVAPAAYGWHGLTGAPIADPDLPGDDDVAFVQCSSGSTSTPKGCMLTPRAIAEQIAILAEMADAEPGAETVCSWLPLSHDMGTFGCLLFAWANGFDLVLSAPERFVVSPRSWFEDCAAYGATLTAGPNGGLHFAARAVARGSLPGPLSLKVCVIGAERIEWSTLEAATAALGPYGFTPEVMLPAYGLAEATLVVSAIGAHERPSYVAVDAVALADGEVVQLDPDAEGATRLVSVGRPCRGVDIELANPGRLSEILVKSPSLSLGYLNDPARTAARFGPSGFRTADLGFERDGELYIVGRYDDVLSVAGRKVYAGELEAAIGGLGAVRPGCCTIVDVPSGDGTRLVMLAEVSNGAAGLEGVATAAAEVATTKAGVNLAECVFLPKGALPKTPSGKIQRFRCRQMIAGGRVDALARVTP
jgi:acyl-CoA synthetase (AMP-forming)/AMP-acid ligase II